MATTLYKGEGGTRAHELSLVDGGWSSDTPNQAIVGEQYPYANSYALESAIMLHECLAFYHASA